MRVTVLGGSAAGPNAGAGSAGFLVQHEETSIICDLGPGTLLEARKHTDVHSLTGIVITHYHLDHVADLGAFRYLLEYGPRRPARRIPLHVPAYARQYLDMWSATFGHGEKPDFFDSVFDVRLCEGQSELAIGELTVHTARTVHPVEAYALRVSARSGLDFGYTADTGPAAGLAGNLSGVGLLASEATEVVAPEGEDRAERGHLTAFEAGELATATGARLLMLTHLWQENGLDRAAADARTRFDGPVLVARPGLTVHL